MTADREEFLTAAREAGFPTSKDCPTCHGSGNVPGGPVILHTYAGPFGADWDLDTALEFIATAEVVEWSPSIVGHDLAATKDGRTVRFQVTRP